jgi:hypothetical protein
MRYRNGTHQFACICAGEKKISVADVMSWQRNVIIWCGL